MRRLLVIAAFLLTPAAIFAQAPGALRSALETIRVKHHLPAVGAAWFTVDGLQEQAVTGVRKAGTDVPATIDDGWHLGSDTKAMTAALLGTYVNEGKLSWDAKVISFFPEFAGGVPDAVKQITLSQVLSHRAGMKENLEWGMLSLFGGSLPQQRLAAVKEALEKPAYPAGDFHYANTDYVIAGAIAEKLGGRPWEELIRQRVFEPLHMASAGFGGLGTPGQIDEPWPHRADGTPTAGNGPGADNPPVMAPAGEVHCTMADWAKFLVDQLRGGSGLPALLPASVYQEMQTPHPPEGDYGYGWIVVDRPWAGGKALNHGGSNTMNFAVAWLAPKKGFGLLVCTNQGGDEAFAACDEAATWLILNPPKAPGP